MAKRKIAVVPPDVIAARAEGRQIECRPGGSGSWFVWEKDYGELDPKHYEYRVSPNPYELWILMDGVRVVLVQNNKPTDLTTGHYRWTRFVESPPASAQVPSASS